MKNSSRELGDRDEQRIAQRFNGKVIAGSGSSAEKKGDVRIGRFLVQAKCTRAHSIGVKFKDLENIQDQALNCRKLPAYFMTFYTGPDVISEWVALPSWILPLIGFSFDPDTQEKAE